MFILLSVKQDKYQSWRGGKNSGHHRFLNRLIHTYVFSIGLKSGYRAEATAPYTP